MSARASHIRERWFIVFQTRWTSPGAFRLAALAILLAAASATPAQERPYHYFHSADMPPGAIGAAQLMRGGPLPGYFQAVEISAPQDTQVALAMDGVFDGPQPAPLRVGLLVGSVYRLKVTNLPFRPGQEVFPSIEIINRLYPPCGSEAKFPIPIELTREELELAIRGQYVVRVIYLENPRTALPSREDPRQQRYFEVGSNQDPLEVADALGRPMAILRIGSRVPEQDNATGRFLFDSAPWVQLPAWIEPPAEATPDASQPAPTEAAPNTAPTTPTDTTRRPSAAVGATR